MLCSHTIFGLELILELLGVSHISRIEKVDECSLEITNESFDTSFVAFEVIGPKIVQTCILMILAIHIQFFGHLELINQLLDDSLPLQSIVQIRREFEFQIHLHELINVSVLYDVSLFQTVLDVLDRNSNSLFVVELIISCRLVQSVFFGEILEGTTVILRRTTDILRRTTVILRHALHGLVVVSRSH